MICFRCFLLYLLFGLFCLLFYGGWVMITNSPTLTPIQSNGGQLDLRSQIVAIDYLNINYRGKVEFSSLPPKYTVEYKDFAGKIFKHKSVVSYKGVKFLDVLYDPRSSALDAFLVQVRVHNLFLWASDDWYRMLVFITHCMGLNYSSINRLDICNDFNHFKNGMTLPGLVHHWTNGDILLKGREKKVQIHTNTSGGKPVVEGFSLGKRGGERYVRCYDKSAEMKANYKDYIDAAWSIMGIDVSKPVYRLEVELSNRFFRKLDCFLLSDLVDFNRVLGLFELGLNNYFSYVIDTGKKEINKNPALELTYFYDLLGFDNSRIHKYVKTKLRNNKNGRRSQMIVLKALFREYLNADQSIDYSYAINRYIWTHSLDDHFIKKYEHWIEDIEKDSLVVFDVDYCKMFHDIDCYSVWT